jgi:DNA repair protein RecO
MELNVTAVAVKASDYKENDKMLRLFTPDNGIITAVIKGVKKQGAKLKFAAQPFSFCEYRLAERNGFYTVTGAVQNESLYELTQDPDRFSLASVILEAADRSVSHIPGPALFVFMLKVFKALIYDNKDPYFLASVFLSAALKNAGLLKGDAALDISGAPESGDGDYIRKFKLSVLEFEKRIGAELISAKAIQFQGVGTLDT